MVRSQRRQIIKQLDVLTTNACEEIDLQTCVKQDQLDDQRLKINALSQQLQLQSQIVDALVQRKDWRNCSQQI